MNENNYHNNHDEDDDIIYSKYVNIFGKVRRTFLEFKFVYE